MDLEKEIEIAKAKKVSLMMEISRVHDNMIYAERRGEKIEPENGPERLSQLKSEALEVNEYILELEERVSKKSF